MSYLCDIFFVINFIIVNCIIPLRHTQMFLAKFQPIVADKIIAPIKALTFHIKFKK